MINYIMSGGLVKQASSLGVGVQPQTPDGWISQVAF